MAVSISALDIPAADSFDHHAVELGMLHLLHPMMFEHVLEAGIEASVVVHAVDKMPLRHPLDVENDQRHR